MTTLRSLFDPSRALNRPIEKVITYQERGDAQLLAEISEYVVTDRMEASFEDLLKKMQTALGGGGGHEIGVWVSGFYGSGKSSFTKYMGFAVDRSKKVEDKSFLSLLQNQLKTAPVKALFNQVSTTYDPVVIFLDLASEMLAGASMEDISTVLYLKVLQWAGYSEDLKVSELERQLEADGKLEAFHKEVKKELDGTSWREVHNQPLVANQIAARLACKFYPKSFAKPEDFQNITLHVNKSEVKRTQEMVELIRKKSGKKNIIFIIDEVGQYVSAKPNLILNLDGLAKNLKQLGEGAVWIFATAQQTLTEDNPSAMVNAPGLFKLKDRFPIQVHLEASDIKEICHKRLLTKSADGEKGLGKLFDSHGASLRTATQLHDAGVYESGLNRKTFIDLYPFLPAHFEILLQLLGRLARKTGGLGLRSAIKVLQDVLIDRGGRAPGELILADTEVGTLANTVTFYDSLRRDIQSTYSYIVEGVERVAQRFPKKKLHLEVAKSVGVLQILENLPVTARNIAALLHPSVTATSLKDDVEKVIAEILKDTMIPLGEKNGSLRFLTQEAIALQKQFDEIEYRHADVRAVTNGTLRSLFHPLPSTRLDNARPVNGGIAVVIGGGQSVSLDGEKEPIQFKIEFTPAEAYDATRGTRETDSRATPENGTIYVLGRQDVETERLAITLARCQKFLDQHRTASDPETQDFIRIVDERMRRTTGELETQLRDALLAGSFIARGAYRPVKECGLDLPEASKAILADIAAKVFDRYSEAPYQADSGLAEKFLKTPLDKVTSAEDPLKLVGRVGGGARVKTDVKAITSIKDYLGQNGQVEGRRLLDHFNLPPFGWSKDTTRYLLAAAFLGTEIKLRISGQDHLVRNDDTLASFASNKAISNVGISLRKERPDPEALSRASDRLRELTGENVLPLEDEIATVAKKYFAQFQQMFGSLGMEMRNLGLSGPSQAERAETLAGDLTEVVSGDGSDAVKRLGGTASPLYDSLVWARKLKKALENGLKQSVSHLNEVREQIEALPESGIPLKLKGSAKDSLSSLDDLLKREEFFEHSSALGVLSLELDKLVSSTVRELMAQQSQVAASEMEKWQASPDWTDLTEEDRDWVSNEVAKLNLQAGDDLGGLRKLLAHDYTLNNRLRDLAQVVAKRAAEARTAREGKPPHGGEDGPPQLEQADLAVPKVFTSTEQIDLLVRELQRLRVKISGNRQLQITWKPID